MKSRARILTHPIHPMLIPFPIAIFPVLLLADVLFLGLGNAVFWTAGFWLALVGLVATAAAAVPGFVDFTRIPDRTNAHGTAVKHMAVGVTVLVAYAVALMARWPAGSPPDMLAVAVGVDVVGVALVVAQGWLGGSLTYKHHVGVLTRDEGGEPVQLGSGEPERDRFPAGAAGEGRRR